MARSNELLGAVDAVSRAVSRLLPVVEHIPDSFGKWVPPIKKAVQQHQRLAAQIGLVGAATRTMRGRLTTVDAAFAAINLKQLGFQKRWSVISGVAGFAISKIISGFRRARRESEALEKQNTQTAFRMGRMSRGGGGGSFSPRGLVAGLGAFGVYRLAREAQERLAGAYHLGGSLSERSGKTGIEPGQLLILEQAAKDAGIEDITGTVIKMQDALVDSVRNGVGPAARALDILGLEGKTLLRELPVAQLTKIGAALNGIQNPALRSSVARDLFGKSGAEVLPLFAESDPLGGTQKSLGRQAELLAANAAAFDAVSDRLQRSGLKLQGFFVGAATTMLPLMDAVTKRLEAIDLASQGERFGNAIRDAVNALYGVFADPAALFDSAGSYIKASLLDAANQFYTAMQRVFNPRAEDKDHFGANAHYNRANEAGHVVIANAMHGAARRSAERAADPERFQQVVKRRNDQWTRFRGFRTFAEPMLRGAGLAGAGGAWQPGGLFSNVTEPVGSFGALKTGGISGAYGRVRAGDAARRKAAEADRKREQDKVDKTNNLLGDLVNITREAWE